MTQEKTTPSTNSSGNSKKCFKSKSYFWIILFIIFIVVIFYYWYKLPHPTMVEPVATQNVVAERAVTTFVNHDTSSQKDELQYAETNQNQVVKQVTQNTTQNDMPLQGENFKVPSEEGNIAQPVNIIAPAKQDAQK